VLVYLNPGWRKEDGGALRLFPKTPVPTPTAAAGSVGGGGGADAGTGAGDVASSAPQSQQPGKHAVDVYPEGGRLAMFYSADIPHEVSKYANIPGHDL